MNALPLDWKPLRIEAARLALDHVVAVNKRLQQTACETVVSDVYVEALMDLMADLSRPESVLHWAWWGAKNDPRFKHMQRKAPSGKYYYGVSGPGISDLRGRWFHSERIRDDFQARRAKIYWDMLLENEANFCAELLDVFPNEGSS